MCFSELATVSVLLFSGSLPMRPDVESMVDPVSVRKLKRTFKFAFSKFLFPLPWAATASMTNIYYRVDRYVSTAIGGKGIIDIDDMQN